MTTFNSTKESLKDILEEIGKGKIQLPDFQRGWVWDDDHIRDLLVSIGRSFPIGAVMLLEAGGDVHFATRPVEGLEEKLPNSKAPEKLILRISSVVGFGMMTISVIFWSALAVRFRLAR